MNFGLETRRHWRGRVRSLDGVFLVSTIRSGITIGKVHFFIKSALFVKKVHFFNERLVGFHLK